MAPGNRKSQRGCPRACLAFFALLAACAVTLAAPVLRADEPGGEGGMRALWVVRSTMTSRERVERMIRCARQYGVSDLFVQVRGRADAYYRSAVEPVAEALEDTSFDPLAYAIQRGHESGLRVHAWVNTFLVWSASGMPRSPAHLVNAHPDWTAIRPDGRGLWSLTRDEMDRTIVEGVFTAPGNPAVREEFLAVVRDILARYEVDGIHLDYVRYPSAEVGYDFVSRTEFMRQTGVDPAWIVDRPEYISARFGPGALADLERRWQEWRKASVTATVRGVRALVDSAGHGVKLSAAVISDLDAAEGRNRQDWLGWLRDGLIDFAMPMTYTPSVRTFEAQLRRILAQSGGKPVVAGLGVYDQPAYDAARKIRLARSLGVAGVSLFSYDAIETQPSYWQAIRSAYENLK